MIAISFYKNQRELAENLNNLIDMYWENKLDENILVENIINILNNNRDKILKDNHFTKILQQQCGKKRLDLIDKILKSKAEKRSNNV